MTKINFNEIGIDNRELLTQVGIAIGKNRLDDLENSITIDLNTSTSLVLSNQSQKNIVYRSGEEVLYEDHKIRVIAYLMSNI